MEDGKGFKSRKGTADLDNTKEERERLQGHCQSFRTGAAPGAGSNGQQLEKVRDFSTNALVAMLSRPELGQEANRGVRQAVLNTLREREGEAYVRSVVESKERPTMEVEPETDASMAEPKHVDEGVQTEMASRRNGHVDYWLDPNSRISPTRDGAYRLDLRQFNLHTRVAIRDKGDPSWSNPRDFEAYINGGSNPEFATYKGIMAHEQQHVQEVMDAWASISPRYLKEAEELRGETPEEVEIAWDSMLAAMENEIHQEYFRSGEKDARSVEWGMYKSLYGQQVYAAAVQMSENKEEGEPDPVMVKEAARNEQERQSGVKEPRGEGIGVLPADQKQKAMGLAAFFDNLEKIVESTSQAGGGGGIGGGGSGSSASDGNNNPDGKPNGQRDAVGHDFDDTFSSWVRQWWAGGSGQINA